MVNADQFKKLIYEHEVLWARLEIRDHYLNKVVQEVYENIGQVLSLVRVQLALLSEAADPAGVTTAEPGLLVGQVIKDFRALCRNFHPETEFLHKLGFLRALENELTLAGPEQVPNAIGVTGNPRSLAAGTELIVFRMLQEVLFLVRKEYRHQPVDLRAIYDGEQVTFLLEYEGKPVDWTYTGRLAGAGLSSPRLNLPQRAEVVEGHLEVSEQPEGKTSIKLIVPYN